MELNQEFIDNLQVNEVKLMKRLEVSGVYTEFTLNR